jgi:hypothetical protein
MTWPPDASSDEKAATVRSMSSSVTLPKIPHATSTSTGAASA